MKRSTIVVCLVLMSPCPALGCFDHAGQTAWLKEMPAANRDFAAAGAAEDSMAGAWLAAVGSASLTLVAAAFRAFSRASGRGRARPVEPEPAKPGAASSPGLRPGEAWLRLDPGHEPPGTHRAVEAEEALSGALAMQ